MASDDMCYVLGIDYEVKDQVHWSEAVTHILNGTMTPFKVHPTKRVRSAGGSVDMARPLMVRLNYWVPVRRKKRIDLNARASRAEILQRDGRTCAYCGSRASTVDHILSESWCKRNNQPHNGWTWGNLVAACVECNGKKADKSLKDSGMKLLWQPHTNVTRYGDIQAEVWRILEEGGGFIEESISYEGVLVK